jgi:hypothetical protein
VALDRTHRPWKPLRGIAERLPFFERIVARNAPDDVAEKRVRPVVDLGLRHLVGLAGKQVDLGPWQTTHPVKQLERIKPLPNRH